MKNSCVIAKMHVNLRCNRMEKITIKLDALLDYGYDSVSRDYIDREKAIQIVNGFFDRIEKIGGDQPK